VSITRVLPLFAGHVEVGAQSPPDVPGVDTVLDGLNRGAPAESGQHMVDQKRGAAHRTELGLDQFIELGQPHATKLPSGCPVVRYCHRCPASSGQRRTAYLHRIGHRGDALSGPPGRLPVPPIRQHLTDRVHQ